MSFVCRSGWVEGARWTSPKLQLFSAETQNRLLMKTTLKTKNNVGRSCRKLRRSMELTCALARGFHSYRWSFIRVEEKYCSHEIIVCVFVFKKKAPTSDWFYFHRFPPQLVLGVRWFQSQLKNIKIRMRTLSNMKQFNFCPLIAKRLHTRWPTCRS